MVLSFAIAACLLGAAPAPAAPPRTGQEVLSERLPKYPGAPAPTKVGETLQAHGVPMNIQSFTTPDDPRKVLSFYRQAFEALHLPVLGDGDLLVHFRYPSVTAFDDANQVDISVVAIRDVKDGLTTVLLALADIQGLHDNVANALEKQFGGLPPYAGALAPRSMLATDGERRHVVVSFATDDVPEQVLSFYAAELGKRGFQAGLNASPGELQLTSANASWHLVARREPEGKRTVVMATWSNSAAAEDGP